MNKSHLSLRRREQGFGVVEVLLVLVLVVLLGGAGWYVWQRQHASTGKNSQTGSNTTPQPQPDPYAGWKTYTLQYEKLTLKYPSSWTVDDQSTATARHDEVTFSAANGFSFTIIDGVQNGGDPLPLAKNDPVAVQFLGSPAYLVFIHPKVPQTDGPSVTDTSTIGSAILLGDANNQALFKDKNVLGSSQYNGVNGPEGSYMSISMGYGGKNNMSVQNAKNDAEYKNSVLVIQSMHY